MISINRDSMDKYKILGFMKDSLTIKKSIKYITNNVIYAHFQVKYVMLEITYQFCVKKTIY
jgi:hypothetical protein